MILQPGNINRVNREKSEQKENIPEGDTSDKEEPFWS